MRDKAKHREAIRRWEKNNPDKTREYNRKWRQNNKGKMSEYFVKYHTRKIENGGDYTNDEFLALCEHFGNQCLKCGEVGELTADHVVPISKGGGSDISNIQPLCRDCNSSKGDRVIDYRSGEGYIVQLPLFSV